MKYKKSIVFICLLICLFSISSVVASDVNETVEASDVNENICEVDDVKFSYSSNEVDDNREYVVENNEVQSAESNSSSEIYNNVNVMHNSSENNILSSNGNDEVLGGSPSYNQYSVSVADKTLSYSEGGLIYMYIKPYTDGWRSDYKYDFYFKVYDSNGIEKISQRYYSSNLDYSKSYNIGVNSLSTGVYTIKIINYKDRGTMSTAKLTIVYVPSSAYSVKVSDTTLTYGVGGFIDMSITPASNYKYKYDFYFKVYDLNGTEKISQRYYSTSSDYSNSYHIGGYQLKTGYYTIKILNNIDNSLMSTTKLTVLSVPSYAYSVNVYDTTINYGSKGNIDMFITPSDNKFYYKYDFYLKVYNSRGYEKISQRYFGASSDISKTFTIDSLSLGIGEYTIKILNNIDNSLMSTAILSIIKTNLQTQDVTGNCNETIEYKVRVSENNNYKSGLNVTIICNNEEYHILTDNDGYASLNIHLKAGTYNVRTIFQNTINENSIIINPVYVANVYKNVYIKSFNGYHNGNNKINYGWEGNLEGYFKIYKGKKLVYQTKFNSNGNIYDYFNYTSHNNQYTGVVIEKVGTYTSVIMDVYGNILVKSTTKIKKANTKVTASGQTFDVKLKTKNVIVSVKDNKGPIKNVKLTLKINGKKYSVKTNSKGVATFKVNKLTKKGTYKATVSFKGNTNYNKFTKTFKVTVKVMPKYKIVTLSAKYKWLTKKVGKYKIKYTLCKVKHYGGYYNYVDIMFYKNGKLQKSSKYLSTYKYKENGKWKWQSWRHGYADHGYHRYITILPVSQIKVKWIV